MSVYKFKKDTSYKKGTRTYVFKKGQEVPLDARAATALASYVTEVGGKTKKKKAETPAPPAPPAPPTEPAVVDAPTEIPPAEPVEPPADPDDADGVTTPNYPEYEDLKTGEWLTFGNDHGVKFPKDMDTSWRNKRAIYDHIMSALGVSTGE